MASYEDIELGIRSVILSADVLRTVSLRYWHPPLYFVDMRKPFSIGQSLWRLRMKYSFPVWLVTYLHALRFLIFGFVPVPKAQQWFKISLGVLAGPFLRKERIY